MISFNKIFDINKMWKYWHQRNTIRQSCNIGTYTSPKLKITQIEDDNFFPFTYIEHEYNDHESNNIPTSFDEININEIKKNHICTDMVVNMNNKPSHECINYSSYLAICKHLFNNIKFNCWSIIGTERRH